MLGDLDAFVGAGAVARTGLELSLIHIFSFCNAAPLLISDFFSAPLAKQKETRYNMTERT